MDVKFIWVFGALILASPFTYSSFERAEDLLWNCDADPQSDELAILKQTLCMGYISGMIDSAQVIFALKPESKMFCSPAEGMSGDQKRRIVVKYIQQNPEQMHKTARASVLASFIEAFPCPQ